jgi:hypothetical protein
MKLRNFLNAVGIEFDEKSVKIHFASNQGSDPLLAFYEGRFQNWQEDQRKKNFSLPFVMSFIQLERPDLWLYVGLYNVLGFEAGAEIAWRYSTELLPG